MNNPKLKASIADLQENVPLAKHTYMKIGGPARYFVRVTTKDAIVQAVLAARFEGVPYRVLGGGSNVLVADAGFNGLVIRCVADDAVFDGTRVTVGAGFPFSKLASLAGQHGLTGLEFALGIPGTVGGAVYGNAGAFGKEMKNVLTSATILTNNGDVVQRSNAELQFGYRTSILKQTKETVLAVALHLQPGDATTIKALHTERLAYRKEHQPLDMPSLGSVFQNMPITAFDAEIIEQYQLPDHPQQGGVPAGYLIDRCELKGFTIGGAQVSPKHANFIVNLGQAKAEHVIMLVSAIKQKVRVTYGGAQLREEIQYLGFDQ